GHRLLRNDHVGQQPEGACLPVDRGGAPPSQGGGGRLAALLPRHPPSARTRLTRSTAMMSSIVTRLRSLRQRRRVARELDDELRFHVEMEIRSHLERGIPLIEARRLAL